MRPGTSHCPIECPELEACIGEELACDGIHHCPVTANDESPEKCVTFPFTLVAVFSSAAVALITMIILLLVIRHRLKNSTSKSVIPPPEMYRNDCKHSSLTKPPVRQHYANRFWNSEPNSHEQLEIFGNDCNIMNIDAMHPFYSETKV